MGKDLTEKDFDQVEFWIGTGPKTFNLLYSITRDGCDASVFHQKCDNQGPTLTVLYNKEGSVYGGYTSVSWESPVSFVNKCDGSAFLFQLYFSGIETPKKFSAKTGQQTISANTGYGPIFGSSSYCDLYTFNGAVHKSSSGEYNLNGHMQNFGTLYESKETSSNDINNGHLRMTELKVYVIKNGQRKTQVLPTPWRKTAEWSPKLLESLKEEVKSIQPLEEIDVPHFNILIIGPSDSGKSSFCNLVASVFRGRISQRARVGRNSQTSTTTMFTPYTVGGKACLKLYDTRGIAETDTLDLLQCNFILDGHVPDFYEMTPTSLISFDDSDFQHKPSLSDKMHCAVFVLNGSTVGDISTPMLHKLMSYQNLLNKKGIPQVVLVTKSDKLCEKNG
ncbi:interferon-induced protein 44-like [Mya arenaria]|uniref:interferon-induced protein 44-like n=1 Tax=Mya arenaria TaxID=6604 RepID=UPI0022E4BC2E|nr:interferon-induced protein 44-like [Mya arenaria]